MDVPNKSKSLRLMVFTTIGLTLFAFILAFIFLYRGMTTNLLLDSEQQEVDKHKELVNGLLDKEEAHLRDITSYLSTRPETGEFVRGENPDFIKSNWPKTTPLESFNFDFMLILDDEGNIRYQEFRDSVSGKSEKAPYNFPDYIRPFASQVMDLADNNPLGNQSKEPIYKDGFIFVGSHAYHACITPIILYGKEEKSSGTVIIGNKLTNEYYQKLTNIPGTNFSVYEIDDSDQNLETKKSNQTHSDILITRTALNGETFQIKMEIERTFYLSGQRLITSISLILLLTAFLFVLCLYVIHIKTVITPIENFNHDILDLKADESIDVAKYETVKEYASLCDSVNIMTSRLKESSFTTEIFQNILNGIDALLYVTDIDSDELLFMNNKMKEHYELNSDVEGQICWKVLQTGQNGRCSFCPKNILQNAPDEFVQWDEDSLLTGRKYHNTDCFIDWPGGRKVHLQHSIDVTQAKIMEEELISAKEQAEQASYAKSGFLSRMSHEIRTPINAIVGMTSIGKNSTDLNKIQDCMDKINDASEHLLGVINDILDMSKIESGKFELSNTDFLLEEMLLKISNVNMFRIEQKKQQFLLSIDQNVPPAIVCDEQHLSQVITNLISNAVKFTEEEGKISLFIQKLGEKNGESILRFEMKDNGIGISKEQQRKLFHSFEQADGSISRRFGGSGLGLSISKSIVTMMGGEIWIDSEPGRGSSFIFTIRAKTGSARSEHILDQKIFQKKEELLIVDPSDEIRNYFVETVFHMGLNCKAAATGTEAIALVEEKNNIPYIFINYQLLDMDSLKLSYVIKQMAPDTMITLICPVEGISDDEKAMEAGISQFISKPLLSGKIIDVLNESINTTTTSWKQIEDAESGFFSDKKLLLAEDIDINREIVIALLEHTGVTIDCAENGQQAYDLFTASPKTYDLIFMDVQMPDVDGITATKKIRSYSHPWATSIPIVAMTANVFKEDIEECLNAGMNDHIGKPVNVDEIITKMKQYL